ncbi:MAG: hypothetical protein EP329_21050 [Deltaproteobacteria bacterium]|nr:MAG: hypothetical protein EP329_21050 [Deltaproteobacteria bacterium]
MTQVTLFPALLLLVCLEGVAGATPAPGDAAPPGPTAGGSYWVVGDDVKTREWNSGKTDRLSGWRSLNCTTYGQQYLLSKLKVWREPQSNLDNFIARMEGECTRYRYTCENCVPDPKVESSRLFEGEHRGPGYEPGTMALQYCDTKRHIRSIWLTLDASNDYVKNIAFTYTCRTKEDWGTVNTRSSNPGSDAIPGDAYAKNADHYKELACPEGWVVSAVELRYDTGKSKIRRFKVQCRELRWAGGS